MKGVGMTLNGSMQAPRTSTVSQRKGMRLLESRPEKQRP